MKIFIDSADLEQITAARSCGIPDGATANPSLVTKAAGRMPDRGSQMAMRR